MQISLGGSVLTAKHHCSDAGGSILRVRMASLTKRLILDLRTLVGTTFLGTLITQAWRPILADRRRSSQAAGRTAPCELTSELMTPFLAAAGKDLTPIGGFHSLAKAGLALALYVGLVA